MIEFSITSSSFLLIDGYKLRKEINIKLDHKFNGNFVEGICNSNHNLPLASIIFISDFCDVYFKNNHSNSIINDINNSIITLIKQRLKKSEKPLILAISKYFHNNFINKISNTNINVKIYNKLIIKLNSLKKNFSNLFWFDLDEEFAYEGYENTFNDRNFYLANSRISYLGTEIIIDSIYKILYKISNPPHKVLVLDCDNTLWGGVIGEDSIDKIILGNDGIGKAYSNFQKICKKISDEGTILAVCSKNNISDTKEMFEKNKFMHLKLNDISIFKVNFKEKYKNIIEISKELGVNLNSICFWDDNPIERDKIQKFLPEVYVAQPDNDVENWPKQLINLDIFSRLNITKDDLKKKEQYQIREKFLKNKEKYKDHLKYLKSIKMNIKIVKYDVNSMSRAEQLINKTNQFNLRTQRYNLTEIKNFNKNNKNHTFLIHLKDIYGDHGIIGLIMLKEINKKKIFLENFLISCRVFGRKIETYMMKIIKEFLLKNNYNEINAEYIENKKNSLCSEFFKDHNFTFTKKNNNTYQYICLSKQIKLPNIEIYD